MKPKNPLRYLFPARPLRGEYTSDEEYFEAEIRHWQKRERIGHAVMAIVIAFAVIGATIIAVYYGTP